MGFAFGNIGEYGGQISDMRYRGPEEFPGYMEQPSPGDESPTPQLPGYQQPPQSQQPQQPQQGPAQYYQQMRESMTGMDKALKELEGMQMPGGQYKPMPGLSINFGLGPALFGGGGK